MPDGSLNRQRHAGSLRDLIDNLLSVDSGQPADKQKLRLACRRSHRKRLDFLPLLGCDLPEWPVDPTAEPPVAGRDVKEF
jgi:hypothetical protein